MFGAVDHTEAISSRLTLLQVRSEERRGESALSIGEESFLSYRFDSVDAIEGEAEETVVFLVIDELSRNGFRELNSLTADGCLADFDKVCVDVPGRGGAVTVRDSPGVAGLGFGGFGFGRVVDVVSSSLGSRLQGGEDPAIWNQYWRRLLGACHDLDGCIGTYRSDEPVSKSKFRVCPPMVTGVKYCESYSVGIAATVPSLLAAACLISSGIGFPYLA